MRPTEITIILSHFQQIVVLNWMQHTVAMANKLCTWRQNTKPPVAQTKRAVKLFALILSAFSLLLWNDKVTFRLPLFSLFWARKMGKWIAAEPKRWEVNIFSGIHRRVIHVFNANSMREHNAQMKEYSECVTNAHWNFFMADWNSWNSGCVGTGLRCKRACVSKHRNGF